MTLETIAVMLAGLAAGYLADLVMKRRGYGMAGDALLGVGGSLAGGTFFNVFAAMPGKDWLPMLTAAFVGGVVLIVGQRVFWQAHA
jgi:uncharacterized membrane protein YeaQ/YmgE (transglycosylase-associated protein family)